MKLQARCEKCGTVIEWEQEKMDDYNMLLGKEQHRQCAGCAQLETNAVVNINRFRDPWDPQEADKKKIGLVDDSMEMDGDKPKEFRMPKHAGMREVFLD